MGRPSESSAHAGGTTTRTAPTAVFPPPAPAADPAGRFTDRALHVSALAQEEARALQHNYVGTEHILLGLIREGEGVAARALESLDIGLEAVRRQVKEIIGLGQQAPTGHLSFTPRAKKLVELSQSEAQRLGHGHVEPVHLLLGLVREGEGVAAQILVRLGTDLDRIRSRTHSMMYWHRPEHVPDWTAPAGPPARPTGDLVQAAREGRLWPVIGRHDEIDQLVLQAGAPIILVGERGTGRTAVVEGLAHQIAAGRVSGGVYRFAAGEAAPGAGRWDDVHRIVAGLRPSKILRLFIEDEIEHPGDEDPPDDPGLRRLLDDARVRLVRATTPAAYERLRVSTGLDSRFFVVKVAPPDPTLVAEMLRAARPRYEEHHGISITDDALTAAARFADRNLPGSAFALLDTALATVQRARSTAPGPDSPDLVTENLILEIVAGTRGVPAAEPASPDAPTGPAAIPDRPAPNRSDWENPATVRSAPVPAPEPGAPPGVGRALCVGVGSAPDPGRELPYAAELADRLRTALTGLGYECAPAPEAEPSAAALGTAVHEHIDAAAPGEVLVVHVIAHGERSNETGKLYVVGADGQTHRLAQVEDWLVSVQDGARTPTLFLLDLCYAGTAARLPWQARVAAGGARAWVIAACAPDRAAFDGRLTRAAADVLGALAAGTLDIDPSLEHAPFTTIARTIGQEVKRLGEESDGDPQQVTGSLIDLTSDLPEQPFFRNPGYAPNPARRARAEVDTGVGPFLDDVDEALDAAHFYERAVGHRRLGDQAALGCFSGRRDELRSLVPWMHGFEPGAIRMVTGSPGVGKSALLGVLVCAAHPRLRAPTEGVWRHVEMAPWPIEHLAAVHARQRDLAEIAASLARQLGLDAEPAALVAGVAAQDRPPVVVLDALDEAIGPAEVMDALLLPLARAVRPDGEPACRLLVGTRRWGFEELLREAERAGGLLDLDGVDRTVLTGELEDYVQKLLRPHPDYRDRGGVRGAFATEVARTLGAPVPAGEERWGEFLVAGLYTHHVTTAAGDPMPSPERAAELGREVPRTLPGVFELDLTGRTDTRWLRPLLTALAYARGEGMPAALAARCVPVSGGDAPTRGQVAAALDAARFYLRRSTDTDGTTLYRLFHAGLAEHLRDRREAGTSRRDAEAALLAALLAPLGAAGGGHRWDLAEPYLRRHAIEHAISAGTPETLLDDAEFLIHADPGLQALLAGADLPAATRFRDLVETVDAADPPARREALALALARAGQSVLAERVAAPPHGPPLPWRPVWTVDRPSSGAVPAAELTAVPLAEPRNGGAAAIALGDLRGRPVMAAAVGGLLRLTDVRTGERLASFSPGIPFTQVAIGRVRGCPAIVVAGSGLAGWWDPAVPDRLNGYGNVLGQPTALATGVLDDRSVAVTGESDGSVRLWNLFTLIPLGEPIAGHAGPVTAAAIARVGDRVLAITAGEDAMIRFWDPVTGASQGAGLQTGSPLRSLAVHEAGDRSAVAGTDGRGALRLWDLTSGAEVAAPLVSDVGATRLLAADPSRERLLTADPEGRERLWWWGPARRLPSVAVLEGPGWYTVVTTNASSRGVARELRTGTALPSPGRDHYVEVRPVGVGGRALAALRRRDGSRWLWDPVRPALVPAEGWAGAPVTEAPVGSPAAVVVAAGRLVQVTGAADGTLHRLDLAAGDAIGDPVPGHPAAVTALCAAEFGGRSVVVSGDALGGLWTWDVATWRRADPLQVPGEVLGLWPAGTGYLLVDTPDELLCFRYGG
ncbi:Clp protease N-terminal domain-containing protein [Actinomadura craniellae]